MELLAPSHWKCVDIISDLHLQRAQAPTVAAWQRYLQTTCADAVLILGDLFEVWVGDDVLHDPSSFEAECAQALRAASQRLALYLMHGNRDFLLDAAFTQASGCTLLDDPSVLSFGAQRWLLTHGDALCLADAPYMEFRATVRSAAWQNDFLARPLQEREQIARGLRMQSETRKKEEKNWIDIDPDAARALLAQHRATHLIHGHTHHPATQWLSQTADRMVLSDWDLAAQPPRAEVLRLLLDPTGAAAGVQRITPLEAAATAAG